MHCHAPTHGALTTSIMRLAPKIACSCPRSTIKAPLSCAQFAQHGIHFPTSTIKITPPPINRFAQGFFYQLPFKKILAITAASGICGYTLYDQHQKQLCRQQLPTHEPSATVPDSANNIIPEPVHQIPQNRKKALSDHNKPLNRHQAKSQIKQKKPQTTPPPSRQPSHQNQPGAHDTDSNRSISSSDGIRPYRMQARRTVKNNF